MILWFLIASIFVCKTSAECTFPDQIHGVYSTVSSAKDLGPGPFTVANSTIGPVKTGSIGPDNFTCYKHNESSSTYVFRSPLKFVGHNLYLYYYTCVKIVPSQSNTDLVYFQILTDNDKDLKGKIMGFQNHTEPNMTVLCHQTPSEVPLNYDVFLKQGFEENVKNDSCPRELQATFLVDFESAPVASSCPNGFIMDGCKHDSYLHFNYSDCGGSQNSHGTPNLTCLNTIQIDNMTYTTLFINNLENEDNPFKISCLSTGEETEGIMNMTKTARMCGNPENPISWIANTTESCRPPEVEVPETTDAGPGSEGNVTSNATTQAPPPGTTGQGSNNPGGDTSDGCVLFASKVFLCIVLMTGIFAQ